MPLDLDALINLGNSEAFNQLPLQLASQDKQSGKWWQMQERMAEMGAKLQA